MLELRYDCGRLGLGESGKLVSNGATAQKGQSNGQSRCERQRKKEAEEERNKNDLSARETHDSLQAGAAGPTAAAERAD
jgi:hypothetical protein